MSESETFDLATNRDGWGEIPHQPAGIDADYGKHISYGQLAINDIVEMNAGNPAPEQQEVIQYLAAQDELLAGLAQSKNDGEKRHYNDQLEVLQTAHPDLHRAAMRTRQEAMRRRIL